MADLLAGGTGGGMRLRERFAAGEMVLAPGCFDALGARLVQEAGFPAAYMTGFGSAAALLGRPDVGLLTMPEMVDNARRIAQAVTIPVIADADTGYGNALNVIRTVHEYERRRRGRHPHRGSGDAQEVRAHGGQAGDRRRRDGRKSRGRGRGPRRAELLIIARTDARAVEGLDAALDRARRYAAAGADVLFVEAPQSEAEIEAVAAAFPDLPLLFNYAEGGRTPPVSHAFLRELGFSLVIFPLSALLAATSAIRAVLAEIRGRGTPAAVLGSMLGFDDFLEFIGINEIRELEQRFADTTEGSAGD